MKGKRYYTLDKYYKDKYNIKVFKISLNLGLSCPNIDGTKGFGGCIYCLNGSMSSSLKPLKKQWEENKNILLKKWPKAKYIAYFQNNTNTYGDLDYLKKSFEEVLTYKDVVGINIATRCDAISEECLAYLVDLNKRTNLTIELGLQTIKDETSKLINRGHSLKEFEETYRKLKNNDIKVVVHIINGLPYETKEDMINTVKYLNKLKIDGIKIHMLFILKGTPLDKLYKREKFHVLTKDEYVDIVTEQIKYLNKNIVVHRITGDPNSDLLVEPKWVIEKFKVLNDIDRKLKNENTYQGFNSTILNRAKQLMEENLKEKDIVVDATVGNGYDSSFILEKIPKGHLFGFDIQKDAIVKTNKLLKEKNYNNYTLYNKSHEEIFNILKIYKGKISLIVFNLGYLPGSDKKIKTNYKSTIKALKEAIKLLNKKGHIVITIYPGHQEGERESIKIKEFLNKNNINFKEYHNTDKNDAPYTIDIR